MALIFDLDQTILDTRIAEEFRKRRDWRNVYDLIPKFRLYDGITKVLKYGTENGLPICIVTSSPNSYCKKVTEYWKLAHDQTVCYHDTVNKKPHPEPILRALQLIKAKSENAISFGDRAIDIRASKSANVISVGCLWGSMEISDLLKESPNFVANSPIDLIPIIRKHFELVL